MDLVLAALPLYTMGFYMANPIRIGSASRHIVCQVRLLVRQGPMF